MLTSYLLPAAVGIQIILIYIISRYTINGLFHFLRFLFHNEHLVYTIISLIYLPGTIVHELGHWLAATILILPVYEVSIFPHFEKNQIRLGSVKYEKKDIIRGILVGMAPLFFALLFFWLLSAFRMFPSSLIWKNIIFGYIVFAVSSTMFSSKQDLKDFVFVIPLAIIMVGIFYIFDLRINFLLENQQIAKNISNFLTNINYYLLFSLITNLFIVGFFKFFQLINRR